MKFTPFLDLNTETLRASRKRGLNLFDPGESVYTFYSEPQNFHRVLRRRNAFTFSVRLRSESRWWDENRPYFNVWPAIAGQLSSLAVEKQTTQFLHNIRYSTISIQFSSPLSTSLGDVEAILASVIPRSELITEFDNCLVVVLQLRGTTSRFEDYLSGNSIAEYAGDSGHIPVMFFLPDSNDDTQIGDLLDGAFDAESCDYHDHPRCRSKDDALSLIRVALSVLMMQSDPDLIDPVILNADRDRYDRTEDPERRQQLADRAIRRTGRVGFDVGRNIETSPHLRRGHLALFHTGKNREVPVIKWRKPCVVKRQKLTEVPTGFLGGAE